jgi:hypothetical protein
MAIWGIKAQLPYFPKGTGFGVFLLKSTSFVALGNYPASLCPAPVKFDAHSTDVCARNGSILPALAVFQHAILSEFVASIPCCFYILSNLIGEPLDIDFTFLF